MEPHKLDRVIAAGQLDLGDASERSSSDSDVALRSHEYFDTPGGTRDTEGSWPDVSRAGCPTVFYPDESRRESVSDRLFSQAGRRLRRTGRWMILLCIRSSDGKKGSFDVKRQPYAS